MSRSARDRRDKLLQQAHRQARAMTESISGTFLLDRLEQEQRESIDLDTQLARRSAAVIYDLWGSDPDAPESAPTQEVVAIQLGYRSKRGYEKALAADHAPIRSPVSVHSDHPFRRFPITRP